MKKIQYLVHIRRIERKKKWYINWITGEVVYKYTWLGAYIYFKRDGHQFKYKVTRKDIERGI